MLTATRSISLLFHGSKEGRPLKTTREKLTRFPTATYGSRSNVLPDFKTAPGNGKGVGSRSISLSLPSPHAAKHAARNGNFSGDGRLATAANSRSPGTATMDSHPAASKTKTPPFTFKARNTGAFLLLGHALAAAFRTAVLPAHSAADLGTSEGTLEISLETARRSIPEIYTA